MITSTALLSFSLLLLARGEQVDDQLPPDQAPRTLSPNAGPDVPPAAAFERGLEVTAFLRTGALT